MRAVDDLDALAFLDDAYGASGFQGCIVDQGRIGYGAAQARSAAVDGSDVLGTTQGAGDGLADDVRGSLAVAGFGCGVTGFDVGFGVEFRFHIVVFTARCLEVELLDEEREDEVVEEEVDDADRDDVHPVGLGFTLQDTEDEQVQQAAREGQADGDVQHVGDHVSGTGQDDLDVEEHRCDEEEGEFNRFRDAREHGRQGCR